MKNKIKAHTLYALIYSMNEILDWEIEDSEQLHDETIIAECQKIIDKLNKLLGFSSPKRLKRK